MYLWTERTTLFSTGSVPERRAIWMKTLLALYHIHNYIFSPPPHTHTSLPSATLTAFSTFYLGTGVFLVSNLVPRLCPTRSVLRKTVCKLQIQNWVHLEKEREIHFSCIGVFLVGEMINTISRLYLGQGCAELGYCLFSKFGNLWTSERRITLECVESWPDLSRTAARALWACETRCTGFDCSRLSWQWEGTAMPSCLHWEQTFWKGRDGAQAAKFLWCPGPSLPWILPSLLWPIACQ